MKSDKFKEISG
jgi:iron only hydrogenase large subunit-like protein